MMINVSTKLKAFHSSIPIYLYLSEKYNYEYYLLAGELIFNTWFETNISKNIQNYPQEEDLLFWHICKSEIANLICDLLIEKRISNFKSSTRKSRKLNPEKTKKLVSNIKNIGLSLDTIGRVKDEIDFLQKYSDLLNDKNSHTFVSSWYSTHKLKLKKLSASKSVTLWHLTRLMFFLDSCEIKYDKRSIFNILSIIKSYSQFSDLLSDIKVEFPKKIELTPSHFSTTEVREVFDNELNTVIQNVIVYGFETTYSGYYDLNEDQTRALDKKSNKEPFNLNNHTFEDLGYEPKNIIELASSKAFLGILKNKYPSFSIAIKNRIFQLLKDKKIKEWPKFKD